MIYAPKELYLPVFLSTRLKQKPKNNKLIKYILKHPSYQKCGPKYQNKLQKVETTKDTCKKFKIVTDNRSLISNIPFHLPPDRYNPKINYIKLDGSKGSYWSQIERKPETIVHHKLNCKYLGTHQFYNLSGRQARCDNFKYTFLTNPRIRRPSNRMMLNDPILCYRSPHDPSPANYFPQNHSLEKNISVKKIPIKPLIYRFCTNSTVPAKEFYTDKYLTGITPGPGRFNPVVVIASPVKNCLYEPGMAEQAEMQAINKFRHLPYKKINMNFCEDTRIRTIMGHGHTYLFQGQEKWKPKAEVARKKQAKTIASERPMFLALTYRQMINNPIRKFISIRSQEDIKSKIKPIKIVYNSLAKPIIRRKTKENQKVAFMSGVPRWKEEATEPVFKKEEEKDKLWKRVTFRDIKKRRESKYSQIKSRLDYIPLRLQGGPMIMREKYFTFSNVPQPKILVRTTEVGSYGSTLLPMLTKQTSLEKYFKT